MADGPIGSLIRPWEVEEGGELLKTPVFTVHERRAQSATRPDRGGRFVYLDAPDWVNVLALTADHQLVLIEQFRHGLAEVTVEIPGGVVDDGEDPASAGARELAEETGYTGRSEGIIGMVTPNPALQNNRTHTLLVRDVEQTSAQTLDGNEEIAVRLLPLADVDELIRKRIIHHALVVAAFQHLHLHQS